MITHSLQMEPPYSGKLHRFSVSDYYRMAQVGIIGEDENVELLDGKVVEMSPSGSKHQACIDVVSGLLSEHIRQRAIVRTQGPLRLDDSNEPEPDVSLLRLREGRYFDAHPSAEDVFLVVEVAETSINQDRRIKLPLYASFGVPEVWIVDIVGRAVEVFRSPDGTSYGARARLKEGNMLSLEAFPDVQLAVDALFPGR